MSKKQKPPSASYNFFSQSQPNLIFSPFECLSACIVSSGLSKRKTPRMRGHDNRGISWIVGRGQLRQEGEIYLQETSRGRTCDDCGADHCGPQLWGWLDAFAQEELLLQSRLRKPNKWRTVFTFNYTKVTWKYFSLSLKKNVYIDLQQPGWAEEELVWSSRLLQGHRWRSTEYTQPQGPDQKWVCIFCSLSQNIKKSKRLTL